MESLSSLESDDCAAFETDEIILNQGNLEYAHWLTSILMDVIIKRMISPSDHISHIILYLTECWSIILSSSQHGIKLKALIVLTSIFTLLNSKLNSVYIEQQDGQISTAFCNDSMVELVQNCLRFIPVKNLERLFVDYSARDMDFSPIFSQIMKKLLDMLSIIRIVQQITTKQSLNINAVNNKTSNSDEDCRPVLQCNDSSQCHFSCGVKTSNSDASKSYSEVAKGGSWTLEMLLCCDKLTEDYSIVDFTKELNSDPQTGVEQNKNRNNQRSLKTSTTTAMAVITPEKPVNESISKPETVQSSSSSGFNFKFSSGSQSSTGFHFDSNPEGVGLFSSAGFGRQSLFDFSMAEPKKTALLDFSSSQSSDQTLSLRLNCPGEILLRKYFFVGLVVAMT
jgi:hypothetical protein